MALSPGTRLGPYEILNPLWAGGVEAEAKAVAALSRPANPNIRSTGEFKLQRFQFQRSLLCGCQFSKSTLLLIRYSVAIRLLFVCLTIGCLMI